MIRSVRPLVTIGISTYNRASGYLTEALQSAVRQTYPNLEIVVSDNCSTDNTEGLVRSIGDPRIRYFRQPANIGANNNFNFCLQQARGDYFLLLHDDDVIDGEFVETCMDTVDDNTTVGIIRTGTRVIDAHGAVLWTTPNRVGGFSTTDFMLGWFSGKTTLYLCSTLFNTKGLRDIGGFESKTFLLQDVVAQMRLAATYGRADATEVKASFRRHGNNRGSSARAQDWLEDSLFLLDVMCELTPGNRRDEVRRQGMAYFAQKNYRYVAGIPSIPERLRTYCTVHRSFGYAYSPLRYVTRRYLQDLKRRVRKLRM